MVREDAFEELLRALVTASGVSRRVLAEVLTRVMVSAPHDVPRTDIAKGTMLAGGEPMNPAAVSKAVQALIDEGLLEEDPLVPDKHRAGRPIKPLRLGSQWTLMGIKVLHAAGKPTSLFGLVTTLRADLTRDLLAEEEWRLPDTATFKNVADHIADFAETLRESMHAGNGDSPTVPRKIFAIGVEIAGHVHEGRLIGATHVGMPSNAEFDLATPLQERLKCPVVVDNDVNVLAVRETYRSEYPEQDLALIAVFDDGVGGALILDRVVYRGSGGLAAEPGHQYVCLANDTLAARRPPRSGGFGAECHCGAHDHVDCYAVPARLCAELGSNSFNELAIAEAHTRGKLTPAGRAFQHGGTALGKGIASLINVVNPGRVVVVLPTALANACPEDNSAAAEYRRALEDSVTKYSFSTGATHARARDSTLTIKALDAQQVAQAGAHCAAIRGLDQFIMHARGRNI